MSALASNRVTIPHIWELRLCAMRRHLQPSVFVGLVAKPDAMAKPLAKMAFDDHAGAGAILNAQHRCLEFETAALADFRNWQID